jgi:hypothetical protein
MNLGAYFWICALNAVVFTTFPSPLHNSEITSAKAEKSYQINISIPLQIPHFI